jgi:hypothetical protein
MAMDKGTVVVILGGVMAVMVAIGSKVHGLKPAKPWVGVIN